MEIKICNRSKPSNKSIKKLDNFLSLFRSYGKQPKDIEGVSEQVQLYIKVELEKLIEHTKV